MTGSLTFRLKRIIEKPGRDNFFRAFLVILIGVMAGSMSFVIFEKDLSFPDALFKACSLKKDSWRIKV